MNKSFALNEKYSHVLKRPDEVAPFLFFFFFVSHVFDFHARPIYRMLFVAPFLWSSLLTRFQITIFWSPSRDRKWEISLSNSYEIEELWGDFVA